MTPLRQRFGSTWVAQGLPTPSVQASINVTPLVDVMLVLLIIFLLTLPLMKLPQSVDLPNQAADRLRSSRMQARITVDQAAHLQLNGQPVADLRMLEQGLAQASRNDKLTGVLIFADDKLPYRDMDALLQTLRDSGWQRVGLITQHKAIKP